VDETGESAVPFTQGDINMLYRDESHSLKPVIADAYLHPVEFRVANAQIGVREMPPPDSEIPATVAAS
jgi:hypothetical protein